MINIDFANIDNAKLVGRLLPFWARGRRISLLLQALLHPLVSAHARFKSWALEMYVANHITAQKASLEWYLKYKLKGHFINPGHNFYITHGIDTILDADSIVSISSNFTCFNTGVWNNELFWGNELWWDNASNGMTEEGGGVIGTARQVNVYAPAITDTIDYDHEDYERDIRNIMSRYMINFNKINIITASRG